MESELDQDFLERLRSGDETAFNAVFDSYCPKLFGFLIRVSGRREIAEDLLQETWLRLATCASRLTPETRIGPWLFTVARNLFLSYLRSRALQADRTEELGALHCGIHRAPSPHEVAEFNEFQNQVEASLAGIPLQYREALVLVGIEGFTPAEAAAICRLRPEAFRKRLSRARLMLMDRMDKQSLPSSAEGNE